jgi:N-acetylmuramate 1-kinase
LSCILCHDPSFVSVQYPFIELTQFYIENNLPCPAVLDIDTENHLLLLSDGGRDDLTSIYDDHIYKEYLKKAIQIIIHLQSTVPNQTIASKSFNFDKLLYEVNFTVSAYNRLKETYHLKTSISIEVLSFLEEVCDLLGNYSPMVVCHRDYHSRNILHENGKLTIIDYQDTMMGSHFYDFSSLNYDAYRPMSLELREDMYQYFKDMFHPLLPHFREYYISQCLQRSFKALGSYIMLFNDKGHTKYKESIFICLDNLLEIVQLGMYPDAIFLFLHSLENELVPAL